MRGGFIRYIPSVQSSKSLVFRGGLVLLAASVQASRSLVVAVGLVHLFGSLAGFIVVTFLCVGLCVPEEVFADPLDAGAATVITPAFVLTLVGMVLVFLLEPE